MEVSRSEDGIPVSTRLLTVVRHRSSWMPQPPFIQRQLDALIPDNSIDTPQKGLDAKPVALVNLR
jgi:hypothetical protein